MRDGNLPREVKHVSPLEDGLSSVQYLCHSGSDLLVVNAARASFGKEHETFDEEKDARLINFLARENHIIPFAHPHVTLRLKAPLFVARQLGKHQVGFSWSEESRRYIKTEPEFYFPKVYRKAAETVKQGSSDEEVRLDTSFWLHPEQITKRSLAAYNNLLKEGVCPEQARMVLPQNTYVTWVWTGSLLGWSRVYNLRIDPHSQKETQEYAKAIGNIMTELYPHSWKALKQ